MSEELSFTQALRANGLTQSDENNHDNEETIEETEVIEEVIPSNIPEVAENESVNDNEETIMYIGSKSVMNYVLSIVGILNDKSDVVSIKARGRAINRAVDVVEVVRHRFITDLTIEDISISTQQITRNDGRESNVSAINITIRK